MKRSRVWLAAASGLALSACQAPPSVVPVPVRAETCVAADEVTHSVFLIGAAGAPKLPYHREAELPVDPVLLALRSDVIEAIGRLGVDRVSVVYLGDNIYPRGLVPAGQPTRRHGERVLRAQIVAASDARTVFVAGRHDWGAYGSEGWANVRAQFEFLSAYGERVSMLPEGGCAGPARLDIGEHLGIVFSDPIGFAHARDYPQVHARASCSYPSARAAFLALAAEFEAPSDRHLVLAMHHPLSRELGVTRTAATNEADQAWNEGIDGVTRPGSPLLYAAAHEHSLQLHRDGLGTYSAISGAGSASRVSRVEPLATAMFALAAPGYMRLDAHADAALGLTVLAVRDGELSEPVLRHCLAAGPPASLPD